MPVSTSWMSPGSHQSTSLESGAHRGSRRRCRRARRSLRSAPWRPDRDPLSLLRLHRPNRGRLMWSRSWAGPNATRVLLHEASRPSVPRTQVADRKRSVTTWWFRGPDHACRSPVRPIHQGMESRSVTLGRSPDVRSGQAVTHARVNSHAPLNGPVPDGWADRVNQPGARPSGARLRPGSPGTAPRSTRRAAWPRSRSPRRAARPRPASPGWSRRRRRSPSPR